jgi:PEP-CTERM motif
MNLGHFKLFRNLALSGALAASFGFAHASTITYDLIGVTTSAGALTGTVTINTATDLVTAADITFNDAAVGNPVFTTIESTATYNGLGQDYISGPSNSSLNYGGQVALYFDTANIGSGDLDICLASGPCGTESDQASTVQAYVSLNNGGPFDITGGSLDPDSPAGATAPEPSSLLLLGTGMLSVGVIMARFSRNKAGNLSGSQA